MAIKKILPCLILAAVLLSGCAPIIGTLEVGIEGPGAGEAAQPRAETSPEIPSETSLASPPPGETTPPEQLPSTQIGTVTGQICYPSEFIPAMTAFFRDATSGESTELAIAENQASYSVALQPENYIAFAYLSSGANFGGSYSEAVPCGLSVDCTDHTPLVFEVRAGETTSGIDLCDWYGPPEAMPANPHAARTPLSGLVYVSEEGEYFVIESDGESKKLFAGPGMAVPWVGPHGVYSADNDLIAVDMFAGEQYSLTNTPEEVETSFQFEAGLPEQVLFTALPAGEEGGPGVTGGLYLMNINGTGLRAVDAEANAGSAAASPSGQDIAYGAGETAYLYNWDSGRQVFDPREYGMASPKGQGIASPSWSPLGDQLAWFVNGFFNGKETNGHGIFDLNAKTFRLVHPHSIPDMDGLPPAARWSPDGEWLAVTAYDGDPARNGIWLVNTTDPQQEIFMGPTSSNPVFGPWTAGQKVLAYSRYDEVEGASRIWLYDLVTSEHRLAPLPPNAQAVKWW